MNPLNLFFSDKKDTGAKQRAWCLYDWANSAFATVILAAVLPVYFALQVPAEGAALTLPWSQGKVQATSLWGYGLSISMLLVAVLAPWLGRISDRRGLRQPLFIAVSLIGALTTIALGLTSSGDYISLLGLFILANICFATANVFYNAYLPELASPHEIDGLSARGFALGYLGGGLVLLLCMGLIQLSGLFGFADAAAATRAGFILTGLWWLGFSIPALRLRPAAEGRRVIQPQVRSWSAFVKLLRELLAQRNLCIFLLAFLCYNDGIQTVIAVSAIFARQELGLSQTSILGCFLMIQFLAIPGSLLFGRLADRKGAKNALLLALAVFTGICIFAFRMDSALEFWMLGALVALVLGGSQAISRSLFGRLIPEGRNAEFYGFYAISSRFASVLGPLTFALIGDLTGSTRLSILALTFFFLLGMILLCAVKIPEAARD